MRHTWLAAALLLGGCIDLDSLSNGRVVNDLAADMPVSPDIGPLRDMSVVPCSKGSPVHLFKMHAPLVAQGVEVAPIGDGSFWLAMTTAGDMSGQRIVVGTYEKVVTGASVFREAEISPPDFTTGTKDLRVRVSNTTQAPLYFAAWRPGSTVGYAMAAPAPEMFDASGAPVPAPAFLNVSSNSFNCGSATETSADVSAFLGTRLAVNTCGSNATFEAGGSVITVKANVTDARVLSAGPGVGVGVYSSIVPDSNTTKHADSFITLTSPSNGTFIASQPIALNTSFDPDFVAVVDVSSDSQLLVAGHEGPELRAVRVRVSGEPSNAPELTRVGTSGTVGGATGQGHYLVVYQQDSFVFGSYAADATSEWSDFLIASSAKNPKVAADPITGAFVVTYIDQAVPIPTGIASLVEITCP